MQAPFISVCIPAYKHAEYLRRLLESLVIQSFTDFEIVITDDSPDNSVADLLNYFSDKLRINYSRNHQPLGTPANWNQAIRLAAGAWIKLMHDDDWFSSPHALKTYVDAISIHPDRKFFFSAFYNVNVDQAMLPVSTSGQNPAANSALSGDHRQSLVKPTTFRLKQLEANPVTLLSKNIIGPPSVTIHMNELSVFYDENLKWLVDMDYYIRYLRDSPAYYIDSAIINIGISDLQVTRSSALVREVEIPEHFTILEKTGIHQLNNLLVYDAWWRLMRNLNIRSVEEIKQAGYRGEVPAAIINMIEFQKRLPSNLLKTGAASKSFMTLSYLRNKWYGTLRRNS